MRTARACVECFIIARSLAAYVCRCLRAPLSQRRVRGNSEQPWKEFAMLGWLAVANPAGQVGGAGDAGRSHGVCRWLARVSPAFFFSCAW